MSLILAYNLLLILLYMYRRGNCGPASCSLHNSRKFYKIRGLKMENKKLTMREMICYGIGDITANVYLQFIALFAIVFYTDVWVSPPPWPA